MKSYQESSSFFSDDYVGNVHNVSVDINTFRTVGCYWFSITTLCFLPKITSDMALEMFLFSTIQRPNIWPCE
jgi:uncharacterized Fe-S cluster-containing MiaB family protein